jgi:hypothetical protein
MTLQWEEEEADLHTDHLHTAMILMAEEEVEVVMGTMEVEEEGIIHHHQEEEE